MARLSEDRENLLQDARALVPRVMFRATILGKGCEVFAGFRGESLSLYFGGDPVYHFNGEGELRRAFVDDLIIKAAKRKLWIWQPERRPGKVAMQSRLMTAEEQDGFGEELSRHLNCLQQVLDGDTFNFVGQFPEKADPIGKLREFFLKMPEARIAETPNVK